MSSLLNAMEDLEEKAIDALRAHGWSGQAAKEFVDVITHLAVLRVADLQRRALTSESSHT